MKITNSLSDKVLMVSILRIHIKFHLYEFLNHTLSDKAYQGTVLNRKKTIKTLPWVQFCWAKIPSSRSPIPILSAADGL